MDTSPAHRISTMAGHALARATRDAHGLFVLAICSLAPAMLSAKPTIEGYDLVSSVRVSRTVFDYSYRIRLQGDGFTYVNAKVNVSTKTALTGTTVQKATVDVGQLDANDFVLTTDTFTIRQDRTVPFQPQQLVLEFSGTPLVGAGTGAAAVRVGPVAFLEKGGRAGHEGTFNIQESDPPAGAVLALSAAVFGTPNTVNYQIKAADGALLSQGPMLPGAKFSYLAVFTVPSVPFRLTINAVGTTGSADTWTSSRLYKPNPFRVTLAPDGALLQKGQSVGLTVTVASATAGGPHTLGLALPAGFQAETSSWRLELAPGQSTTVKTVLVAPADSPGFKTYRLLATVAPLAQPLDVRQSSVQVVVR